jgi:NAD(P)H-dependent FMN reductase
VNLIAFHGSPRKGGNTELLLEAALRGAGMEARVFKLNEMNIRPCQDCGECTETGVCTVEDDMVQVAAAIREADRIVLASPVFFMGLSAQAKTMIDRCQQFWCEKYLLKRTIPPGDLGRRGLLLLVGGMRRKMGIDCCKTAATAFFRTVSVPEHATISYMGVDGKGDIEKHPTALGEALEAGRELVK